MTKRSSFAPPAQPHEVEILKPYAEVGVPRVLGDVGRRAKLHWKRHLPNLPHERLWIAGVRGRTTLGVLVVLVVLIIAGVANEATWLVVIHRSDLMALGFGNHTSVLVAGEMASAWGEFLLAHCSVANRLDSALCVVLAGGATATQVGSGTCLGPSPVHRTLCLLHDHGLQ